MNLLSGEQNKLRTSKSFPVSCIFPSFNHSLYNPAVLNTFLEAWIQNRTHISLSGGTKDKFWNTILRLLSLYLILQLRIRLFCFLAVLHWEVIFNCSSTMTHVSSAESLLSRWALLSQKYHEHPLLVELHFTTANTMVCFDWPYQLAWTMLPQQLPFLHCTQCSKTSFLNMEYQSQIFFFQIIYKEKSMRS